MIGIFLLGLVIGIGLGVVILALIQRDDPQHFIDKLSELIESKENGGSK